MPPSRSRVPLIINDNRWWKNLSDWLRRGTPCGFHLTRRALPFPWTSSRIFLYIRPAMTPSPPILSLCSRCLVRRIFPLQSPLLRRQLSIPPISPCPSLIRARHVSSNATSNATVHQSRSKERNERQKESRRVKRERDEEIEREGKFLLHEVENEELPKWVITVGLEVHAQLNTKRKLFSGFFFFPAFGLFVGG